MRLIAGSLLGKNSLDPASASWAKDPAHRVGIFLIRMEPQSSITLPALSESLNRNLYFYEGEEIHLDGKDIPVSHRVKLAGDQEIEISNGNKEAFILVMEGEPIGEPVAQYGPFVMNTEQEIRDVFNDYRRTQFGGWPWGSFDVVNERSEGRFARHGDGKVEQR